VLEASDRFGGTVAHHRVGGIDLDAGAESFATRGGAVAALARELGLGDDIVQPLDEPAWLQPVEGDPVALPRTGLLGIPGTPLAADVIAVVGTAAALRAQLDAIIPSVWTRSTESLGHLVRRRMGRGVLERLVDPVARGVYSSAPDDIPVDRVPGLRAALAKEGSLAAAVRALRDPSAPGAAVAGIRGGVNRLVVELLADLESMDVGLQLGRTVTDLDGLPGTVVLAAPLQPGGRRVTLVTLVVEAPGLDVNPRGTGLLVADGAPIRARALTHSTAKWPWLRERAGGNHVLRLSYDEAPGTEQALADARRMLGTELALVDAATVTWTRAAPQTPPPGVIAVGETVGAPGLAGIVRQAEEAAQQLASDFDAA
jgi:protoporphyrinogen/coproporphyrinogen III oxidase